MLELIDVTKIYPGGKRAVDGITLRLGTGILGLLGPNGAGKSSLMRIAATVTKPTSGRVVFNGADSVADPDSLRRALGYLPQHFGFYPNLSAHAFLSYLAAAKGLSPRAAKSRIDQLLEMVNLTEAAKRPMGKYSGGMIRRAGIAQALLGDPKILIVDEPTAGLDPEERVRFRNLLSDLAADKAVLLSTHIVSDVESVASDIAIVAQGRLVRRGTPEDLLRSVVGQTWELLVPSHQLAELQSRFVISRQTRTPDGVRVRLLSSQPPSVNAVRVAPDLEDSYLGISYQINQWNTAGLVQK